MIRKINWPRTSEKRNPFGGKEGLRSLSITFHSKVYEGISREELSALEILYEICGANHIDVMSFDGKVYPKIVFGEPNDVDIWGIRVVNEDGEPIRFSGIYTSRISNNQIIWIMGEYSSRRQYEFDNARDDIIQVEAHHALRRDIFVTTSPLLLENRDKLDESNIYSPLEALKIVGLYIRNQNEYEWISQVVGNVRWQISNRDFFKYLVRGLLPSNWRFLKYVSTFLKNEDERLLGISVLHRCSSALQACDELAKLFYLPEKYVSSEKRQYHFDYLTLLLTGALDALALILNRVYDLRCNPPDCSLSPSRGKSKYLKKLSESHDASKLFEYISSDSVQSYLEILYQLRNRIHSISLEEKISVPQDAVDTLLDKIYDHDNGNHWGMTKEKVMMSINGSHPTPYWEIKIDKYYLAAELVKMTFGLIDCVMNIVTPQISEDNRPPEELRYIERCKYLG